MLFVKNKFYDYNLKKDHNLDIWIISIPLLALLRTKMCLILFNLFVLKFDDLVSLEFDDSEILNIVNFQKLGFYIYN